MNKKIYFRSFALFILLSSDAMALDFPSATLPGFGGTSSSPAAVLIFSCKNTSTGTNTSGNSSCSSSGGSSSSCSSGSGTTASHSSIAAWEMTADRPALKTILNDINTTCSDAVEAAGAANCIPSGGDILTIYTCKI